MSNKFIGKNGEDIACEYLEKLDYKILERNIRFSRNCELDIIALDKKNTLVVIEVKTEDEVGDLGHSIDKTVTRLKEYIDYIDEISEVLAAMANGKLAIQLKYAYVGEFQKVKEALINISASMTEVMKNITETANSIWVPRISFC